MDKKDLYMAIGELLNNYTSDDIVEALNEIMQLNTSEGVMGLKIIKNERIKHAIGKKKSDNTSRSK